MPLPERPVVVIVGATGLVGRELLALLEERRFPLAEVRLLASAASAGTMVDLDGTAHAVEAFDRSAFDGADLVFFCSSGDHAREHAHAAVEAGALVIDNSSAYRMDQTVPLVVPEINGDTPEVERARLIANPNCSTIIALVAVNPIRLAVGVERMVVSTYQAASGGGRAMMQMLTDQAHAHATGGSGEGRPYAFNLFSHDSPIGIDGQNEEERKLVRETRRIWNDSEIRIAATCVRVPVLRAHCESINLTLRDPLNEDDARRLLQSAPGVTVLDDRAANRFPEPVTASGGDDVLVGRIRQDTSQPPGRGLSLFVAGDQLRKGAALNALQIAEQRIAALRG